MLESEFSVLNCCLHVMSSPAVFKLRRFDRNSHRDVHDFGRSKPHCDVRHRTRTASRRIRNIVAWLIHVRFGRQNPQRRRDGWRLDLDFDGNEGHYCRVDQRNIMTELWTDHFGRANLRLDRNRLHRVLGRRRIGRYRPLRTGDRRPPDMWSVTRRSRLHRDVRHWTVSPIRLVAGPVWNYRDLPTLFCRLGHFLARRKLGASRSNPWTVSKSRFRTMYSVLRVQRYSEGS